MAGHELTTDFADDKMEVAGILLQLPHLILGREFFPSIFRSWKSKKRRSTTNNNNDNQVSRAAVVPPPPEPSSAPPEDREDKRLTEKDKDKATSPATPLSFSPSESDERRKPLKRKFQKTKEEWLEIIKVLKERSELLKKEVENVSRYYDKIKAFNLELKARKEELITRGLRKETPCSKIGQAVNHVMELGGQPETKEATPSPEFHHTPFVADQTVETTGINENPQFSASHYIPSSLSSSGFSGNNDNSVSVSPLGIPDLNVSAEGSYVMDCFQPFDVAMANKNLSRAMASEARRRRRQICKGKTSVAANKLRYPC